MAAVASQLTMRSKPNLEVCQLKFHGSLPFPISADRKILYKVSIAFRESVDKVGYSLNSSLFVSVVVKMRQETIA